MKFIDDTKTNAKRICHLVKGLADIKLLTCCKMVMGMMESSGSCKDVHLTGLKKSGDNHMWNIEDNSNPMQEA